MSGITSSLPQLVLIPGGGYQGRQIQSFSMGKYPVTNEEYRAHADRFKSEPFVALTKSEDGGVSITAREKNLRSLLAKLPGGGCDFPVPKSKSWGIRQPPIVHGAFIVFKLMVDLYPIRTDPEMSHPDCWGLTDGMPLLQWFNRPKQPVVDRSGYQALEYCLANGFRLPTNDEWGYAAGVDGGLEYATSTGQLWTGELYQGGTKLAHFDSLTYTGDETTCDVDDPRYLPGPHDFFHMAGNVLNITFTPGIKDPFALRGSSWNNDTEQLDEMRSDHIEPIDPGQVYLAHDIGFRVVKDHP